MSARNGNGPERMTVAGYTFNDRFSDTSKLHDELDFDKIVREAVGTKFGKSRKERYMDPLDSNGDFPESPLFNSADLEDEK